VREVAVAEPFNAQSRNATDLHANADGALVVGHSCIGIGGQCSPLRLAPTGGAQVAHEEREHVISVDAERASPRSEVSTDCTLRSLERLS
jgi:hypothetical protein